jgi:hypothetical protein
VQDDRSSADTFGQFLGATQLLPRVAAPHPLGEQQVRRVHGDDRELVIVAEPAQRVGLLAYRVGVDHHLDPVVAEPRGQLEGVGGALGVDRRRRQGDGRTGYLYHAAHCWLPPSVRLPAY